MSLSEFKKTSDWVKILREHITHDDLDDEVVYSLISYLQDLGLLVSGEEGSMVWSGLPNKLRWDDQVKIMRDEILKMSHTREGFALSFFIGFEKLNLPTLESLIEAEKDNVGQKEAPDPKRSSDSSNLQIVKKVGRQLKPFIDAEKSIISRLQGKKATKEDARHLFQYIFGKINSKAKPKKWEQLSRKRHR